MGLLAKDSLIYLLSKSSWSYSIPSHKDLSSLKKIAIVTTHPIQYNAPFFRLLSESTSVEVRVFYTWGATVLDDKFDPGFNRSVEWDIPLLEGYAYTFLENTAGDKGSHHFMGIVNPG